MFASVYRGNGCRGNVTMLEMYFEPKRGPFSSSVRTTERLHLGKVLNVKL